MQSFDLLSFLDFKVFLDLKFYWRFIHKVPYIIVHLFEKYEFFNINKTDKLHIDIKES
jgi:hypothetical protein